MKSSLKKVYDRNVVNKYGLYLLLGVIIYNLIDYIYIYMYVNVYIWMVLSLSKLCLFSFLDFSK